MTTFIDTKFGNWKLTVTDTPQTDVYVLDIGLSTLMLFDADELKALHAALGQALERIEADTAADSGSA